MQLKNKKVIVTGGAGGIGTEIAKKLLEQGSVVAIVDFNEDRLERFSESVPENRRHMLELYNTDVSIFSDVKKKYTFHVTKLRIIYKKPYFRAIQNIIFHILFTKIKSNIIFIIYFQKYFTRFSKH